LISDQILVAQVALAQVELREPSSSANIFGERLVEAVEFFRSSICFASTSRFSRGARPPPRPARARPSAADRPLERTDDHEHDRQTPISVGIISSRRFVMYASI
jgi:hypothetical protein